MTTDEGTMILAHPSGSGACVREMVVQDYASAPVDIKGTTSFTDYSAEFSNGYLQIKFTKEEHWGVGNDQISKSASSMRLQWAIGDRSGADDCTASLGYHSSQRGVSHLNWFGMHTPCSELLDADGTGFSSSSVFVSNAHGPHDVSASIFTFLVFMFGAMP